MDPQLFSALGAVMTGIGALVTAIVSTRIAWHRARTECDKRIASMHKSLMLGLSLERRSYGTPQTKRKRPPIGD